MGNRLYIFIILLFFAGISCNNRQKKNTSEADEKITGDSIQNLESLSALIQKDPRNADLFVERSKLHLQSNQLEEAVNDLLIASKLDSLNPDLYIDLADLQLKLGRSGKAKKALERCLEYNPENTDAMIRLANIYFYVKDYKRSMEWLNKCQKVDRNLAQIYFTKGMIYRENEDTENAIKNFQIAVEKEPDYYDAYILLGLLHAQTKDSLAIAYYQHAIRIIPNSVEAHYNLAMYYQQNDLITRALKEYDYIINEIDSLNPNIHYNKGFVYMHYLEDYKQAIHHFGKAIQFDNNFTEAYYNRGFCFEQLKNYEKARQDYQVALELVENYQLAIEGLNRLDQLN